MTEPTSLLKEHVQRLCSDIVARYGYQKIELPIVERAELYKKSGDALAKEIYHFLDHGQRHVALRPEGTAGVVRAVLNDSRVLEGSTDPIRYYYYGPMFRADRPQQGRYRQFDHFGVECISSDSIGAEVEALASAHHVVRALGLQESTKLHINSIGDLECRGQYCGALVKALEPYKQSLSSESRARLNAGSQHSLRILDSKQEEDIEILQELGERLPKLSTFVPTARLVRYRAILLELDELGISYVQDDSLVRGLDYYCETVFEFKAESCPNLGASQSTVLAGGRYDPLFETWNQKHTPRLHGVGWSLGVDRVCLALQDTAPPGVSKVAVIMAPEKSDEVLQRLSRIRLRIAQHLRNIGTVTYDACRDRELSRLSEPFQWPTISKQLSNAHRKLCRNAIIIGAEELARKTVVLKQLGRQGHQIEVSLPSLFESNSWDSIERGLKESFR